MNEAEKRPRGRPRLHAEEPARIDLRMPLELRRQVRLAAARADLGLGEWVLRAIAAQLEREAP